MGYFVISETLFNSEISSTEINPKLSRKTELSVNLIILLIHIHVLSSVDVLNFPSDNIQSVGFSVRK